MIRKFTLLCKKNLTNKSDFQLYEEFSSQSLDAIHLEICPHCKARGTCSSHSAYTRDMITLESTQIRCYSLQIQRVICSSCGHTHAILPDFLIPYGSYSLRFILQVLKLYFLHAGTIDQLCNQFHISRSTLYSWKLLFLCHKKLWLGYLSGYETEPLTFFDCIFEEHFLASFFSNFLTSFLQPFRKTAYSPHT